MQTIRLIYKKDLKKLSIDKKVVSLPKIRVYLGGPVAPSCTINKTKSSSSCLQLELVLFGNDAIFAKGYLGADICGFYDDLLHDIPLQGG